MLQKAPIIILGTSFLFVLFFVCICFAEKAPKKPVKVSLSQIEWADQLKKREDAVEARENVVEVTEKELESLQKELDAKLARLTTMQIDIQEKLEQFKGAKDKEFRNLVKVYSAMSATRLAPLLNKMEDKTVAKILRAMATDAVAKIVPKIDEDKAVRVSKLLGVLD
ncbi:MAG: hypothetical protein KAJ60_09560 [Desulfobulbaceae bacterium]|nr:hypothetical protein [Desulfobulbaceae bacterium]